jgi:hypothetical protein
MKMGKADDLLRGAIDMHFHGYPEFSLEVPRRYTDEESAGLMVKAGMRGVVLKSHFWPTPGLAYYLRKAVPDLEIFSSITFNSSVGGIQKWALESAVKQGVKVAWMPSWSAQNDIRRNGVVHMIRGYLPSVEKFSEADGIAIIDERGKLFPAIAEFLSLIKGYDMALFTSHISILESLELAREAKRIGFKKLILNHPDSRSIGASFEQIVEFASLGGYVEICALGLMPMFLRITPQELKKIIQTVGASRCILTSDYAFEWSPSGPEKLRMLISALLEVGVKEEEIAEMAQANPRFLLSLK